MHKLKGDTLIEVAIAIGIFSLVAITIVAVTTASTNSAQASLEVTLTREEIDAQAEALRFIHDSYTAGSQSEDASQNKYKSLWDEIKKKAVDASVKNYNTVSDCKTIYGDSGNTVKTSGPNSGTKPFIINTHNLSTLDASKIVISNSSIFKKTDSFPRIFYGGTESLYDQAESGSGNAIKSVDGLFIVAYQGGNTKIAQGDKVVNQKSTYYDFYIRACWMPPGSNRASTISTVVRLTDPDQVTHKHSGS